MLADGISGRGIRPALQHVVHRFSEITPWEPSLTARNDEPRSETVRHIGRTGHRRPKTTWRAAGRALPADRWRSRLGSAANDIRQGVVDFPAAAAHRLVDLGLLVIVMSKSQNAFDCSDDGADWRTKPDRARVARAVGGQRIAPR
jgi:hypothetical protein